MQITAAAETDLLSWMDRQRAKQGAFPAAVALAQPALPLARALLANQRGLLDQDTTRLTLQGGTGPALTDLPSLPQVPPERREMWLRLLTAHHLSGRSWPSSQGQTEWSHSIIPDPDERVSHALSWGRSKGKPVTYAAANWAAQRTAAERLRAEGHAGEVQVTTLEEVVRRIGGRSPAALRNLSALTDTALVLDGLHRLDPRGLGPVTSLLQDLHAFGQDIHLTGTYPHPLTPPLRTEADRAPARQARFSYHPVLHEVDDLIAQIKARPGVSTLLMLPSRKAALVMQGHFPEARLLTRSKTAHHLREEGGEPSQLTISSWSPSALSFQRYERLITTRLPLPILADACLNAEEVEVLPITTFRVSNAVETATSLTAELLGLGSHPQDPGAHREFWDLLLPRMEVDSLGIQASRASLNYAQTAEALASLFRGGRMVLVNTPESEQEVEEVRKGGAVPYHSQHTVRLTPTSVQRATEEGLIEVVGDTYIWNGPYTSERGVGVP